MFVCIFFFSSGVRFSEDEKHKMIQYLVSKNAFSRVADLSVWKEMVDAEVSKLYVVLIYYLLLFISFITHLFIYFLIN